MRAGQWVLAVFLLAIAGGVFWYMTVGKKSFAPASSRRLSQAGLDAIKAHEGWSASVYLDSAGLPTIGYGHLIKSGEKFTAPITQAQGEDLLRQDVASAEASVRKVVTVPLTQGMYDALVSFTYNVGGGALGNSTLLRLLNAGDYVGAAAQFLRWNKAAGVEVRGLTSRRTAESEMFKGGLA